MYLWGLTDQCLLPSRTGLATAELVLTKVPLLSPPPATIFAGISYSRESWVGFTPTNVHIQVPVLFVQVCVTAEKPAMSLWAWECLVG